MAFWCLTANPIVKLYANRDAAAAALLQRAKLISCLLLLSGTREKREKILPVAKELGRLIFFSSRLSYLSRGLVSLPLFIPPCDSRAMDAHWSGASC
ncbi:hypothetical protein CEXT_27481 [Caerostris extrusa]|uniref:Uncharacterized protein n=1 Tax=Caerostris extrusa TaxID=172846 RepID=A0AAV4SX22_CAEEX|nr:hypothetical protein CEXT_27481 [Caerostris extrusa]